MTNGDTTTKNGNGGNLGFEAKMFKAADKLRGNVVESSSKPASASGLGYQETPSLGIQALSEMVAPLPQYSVRHPEPERLGSQETQAATYRTPGKPTTQLLTPNDVCCADFKG